MEDNKVPTPEVASTWSKQWPKIEGWYWVQDYYQRPEVFWFAKGTASETGSEHGFAPDELAHCEFLGPITPADFEEIVQLREQRDSLLAAVKRAETDFDILITRGDIADEPRAHETLKILRAALKGGSN